VIEKYSAGNIRIKGKNYDEDIKIIGGEVFPHWWRKEGHRIDEEDIRDIFEANPDILVIGTGYAENVRVSTGAESQARNRGIRLISEATPQAVKTFNHLIEKGKSVSGAFHLTC